MSVKIKETDPISFELPDIQKINNKEELLKTVDIFYKKKNELIHLQ